MSSSQFRLGDLLKLILVVAIACAVGPPVVGQHWTIVTIGCVLGLFVAEHFANSRAREFSAILLFPLAFAAVAAIVPLLQSPEQETLGQYAAGMLLGALAGIGPTALTVVAINVLNTVVYRMTGVRLLKYDWSDRT